MAYYQAAIFGYIRDNPGARTPQIAQALGLLREPATNSPRTKIVVQAIQKLRRAGRVRAIGKRGHWEIVPGAKPPHDRRGDTPGSKLALASHSRVNGLKSLAKRGRYQQPVATTALEQAWGWLPRTSPCLTANDEPCSNNDGTVRPQESEAA